MRANAERERTVILADAQREAQRVRGDGDAQAIKIYGDAFGQDKEFFAFYRSLQAYRDALNGTDTAFVLSPEGNFFRFFGGVSAGTRQPAQRAAPRTAARRRPPRPGRIAGRRDRPAQPSAAGGSGCRRRAAPPSATGDRRAP